MSQERAGIVGDSCVSGDLVNGGMEILKASNQQNRSITLPWPGQLEVCEESAIFAVFRDCQGQRLGFYSRRGSISRLARSGTLPLLRYEMLKAGCRRSFSYCAYWLSYLLGSGTSEAKHRLRCSSTGCQRRSIGQHHPGNSLLSYRNTLLFPKLL